MAKRKRAAGVSRRATAEDDYDPSASKLQINSYKDVADSEDEFHINRDKILLDPNSTAKRGTPGHSQAEDDVIELSEEEVLAYPESDSGASEDDESVGDGASRVQDRLDSAEGEDVASEDDETSGWGTSKADYYNADVIENEDDALAEEEEARRIQRKRLKALREEDFGFDENDWLASGARSEGAASGVQEDKFSEALPQLQIPDDMTPQARVKLLSSRYPEIEPLAQELLALQPVLRQMTENVKADQQLSNEKTLPNDQQTGSVGILKFRALSSYLGAIAMYFALITSTAGDDQASSRPMPPHELREHAVMDSMVRARDVWSRVQDLIEPLVDDTADEMVGEIMSPADIEAPSRQVGLESTRHTGDSVLSEKSERVRLAMSESEKRRAERRRRTEESLAALSGLQNGSKHNTVKPTKVERRTLKNDGVDSDLGDEDILTPQEAAQKAQRRKSLRFYTSQMAQKSNKRANAARATGGDEDIPYRERFRDRQERLTKEAERRGKRMRDDDSTNLLPDADDGLQETNLERERRKPYSQDDADMMELEDQVRAKKRAKFQRDEAYRKAKEEGGIVVQYPRNEVGPDGRREIGYVIEKNKGLTPKRKKEAKNPRVKKRKQYENKSKKLRSMKPTFKGGEGRGGYQGERTGIKANLVRGTKL